MKQKNIRLLLCAINRVIHVSNITDPTAKRVLMEDGFSHS